MERLSPLDASFLRAETPSAHMHVGWLATIAPPRGRPRIDPELLRSRIESRLDLAPRFRRRIVDMPVGEPVLVDDPAFSVERHVRVLPVAGDGVGPGELQEVLDDFLSVQLDRAKPLWQILIVPALAGGGGALLGKVHHALVDGVAAVELGTLLFDLQPDLSPGEAPEWEPQLPPSPVRMLIGSATDTALQQFRAAGRMASLGLQPSRGVRVADSMRRAAFAMAREVVEPAPSSYLNGPIGPERTLRTTTLPLDRVLELKRRADSKLNDVVLALVSGALHEFPSRRGAEPGPLRAMIPINVRGEAAAADGGNRIAFGFLELPTSVDDPLQRLRSIRRQSAALRDRQGASGRDAILRSVGVLPGPMQSIVTRFASSARAFNLTVSNVPGPRIPLYAAGGEVEAIFPVIPLAGAHALAIGVLSYRDRLHLACHGDPDRLPGAAELPPLLERALAELDAALPPPARRPPPARGRPPAERRREQRRPGSVAPTS